MMNIKQISVITDNLPGLFVCWVCNGFGAELKAS